MSGKVLEQDRHPEIERIVESWGRILFRPRGGGAAACPQLTPATQSLNLSLARRKTARLGVPRRARKVMGNE